MAKSILAVAAVMALASAAVWAAGPATQAGDDQDKLKDLAEQMVEKIRQMQRGGPPAPGPAPVDPAEIKDKTRPLTPGDAGKTN